MMFFFSGEKLKKQILIVGIIVLLSVSILSGCTGPQITEYFNEEYTVGKNTVLTVSTINGKLEIYSWDGDTVKVDAIKKSRIGQEELDKMEIIVTETTDLIDIAAEYTGTRAITPSVDMNIKIPANVTVESVSTSNGAVIIDGVMGNLHAESSNGDIYIDNVDGYVSASTSNGLIDVESTTGVRDLSSSNGDISAEIFDFQEDIMISTSNGRIDVYLNPELNASIELSTSNGEVSISGLSVNYTTSEEKYIAGTIGDGEYLIAVDTSNGNIRLLQLDI
jgi:DUF4097 and DUF4098 domain-containing protein YvlB